MTEATHTAVPDEAVSGPPEHGAPPPRSWRTGNRPILVLAAVAVVSLVAGLGLSRLVVNPADEAARTAPPEAGPVTVPVERRELSNDVTIRGDAVYDDAVDLQVETADLSERAVVTGQVPEVGATLDAGSVALEVAGRPVIVLPGGLPTYRTLRSGVSGPDVVQLKEALSALGIGAGDPGSDVYDSATAAGVAELYRRAGYAAPAAGEELSSALEAAQQQVRDAQSEVTRAGAALTAASGSTARHSEIVAADAAVRDAERQRDAAQTVLADQRAACAGPNRDPSLDCSRAGMLQLENAAAGAQDAVAVAAAQRAEVGGAPDTSGESSALSTAQQSLTDAQEELTRAQRATLTPLPASEVVFLETLPRRVDAVSVKRGGTVDGTVMSVSGATLQIVGGAARADATLLTVGTTGTATLDGTDYPVTVEEVTPPDGGEDGRHTVTLALGDLTPEEITALQGSNVRVSIPVSSTDDAVLAVPLAALTAGPGGESRVEVLGADGETTLVEVTTGLAAGGYVEVNGDLGEGDLVVVGAAGSGAGASSQESPAAEDDEA